jgi:hypothetical protein
MKKPYLNYFERWALLNEDNIYTDLIKLEIAKKKLFRELSKTLFFKLIDKILNNITRKL